MKKRIKKIEIDPKFIPQHIGIIMDGNRRWAQDRDLPIGKGHEAGAENLKKIVDRCRELGVKNLTVYALSTENWRQRTKKEVKGLFDLLTRIVREKKEDYERQGVKVAVLGYFQAFPRKVVAALDEMLTIIKQHERIKVNVALNYGGRDEIVKAVQRIVKEGIPANQINEKIISQHLYTNGTADPDLIIRTGGEIRLSNFLLWQSSYSELYFADTLWPDFGPEELDKAIEEYQRRERRFGK